MLPMIIKDIYLMKEILTDYILPSGVLLTFIAATINIYYTRKNNSVNANSLRFKDKIDFQEIIKKLYLLKLRFNPKEDLKILNSIKYFIDFYNQKYVSNNDVKEARIQIENLSNQTQMLLKKEWGKVKLETKGN